MNAKELRQITEESIKRQKIEHAKYEARQTKNVHIQESIILRNLINDCHFGMERAAKAGNYSYSRKLDNVSEFVIARLKKCLAEFNPKLVKYEFAVGVDEYEKSTEIQFSW